MVPERTTVCLPKHWVLCVSCEPAEMPPSGFFLTLSPPYFGRWDLSPRLQHDSLAGLAGQSSIPLISASSALGWSTCFALMLNINMLLSWTQGSLSHGSSPLTHLLMHSRKRLIFSGAILLASSSWRVIKTNPTAGASCSTINRVFLLSGFPFPWPILYWTHPRWP